MTRVVLVSIVGRSGIATSRETFACTPSLLSVVMLSRYPHYNDCFTWLTSAEYHLSCFLTYRVLQLLKLLPNP
jgi:hypothetical protein